MTINMGARDAQRQFAELGK